MTFHHGRTQPPLLVLADGSIQLDLFGQTEAELARGVEAERVRLEFESRSRYLLDGSAVMWTAPYDSPAARRGKSVPGWRCWLCGRIEVNDYVLGLNHGLHATDSACLSWTACTRQGRSEGMTPRRSDAREAGQP
jgi:hypothetical protein